MDLAPGLAASISGASPSFDVLNFRDVRPDRRGDVEVILALGSSSVNEKLFRTFPRVRLLQAIFAGVDFIDFSSIPPEVVVCSNAGAYKEPIAEHVFGMFLYFAKHFSRNHERLREGSLEHPEGTFLAGKTLGVVGAGGIGQSVARVAKAFNMHTIGINTTGKPVPNFDHVWKMGRLDELLKRSDFVVLSIPLTVQTDNLMDGGKLALMKPDATLVNVARGPIVSQPDLYAHLKSHPNFNAGIDVWWANPGKGEKFSLDFPFFDLPNFLVSPHNAGGVPGIAEEGQRYAVENILRFVRGEKVERVVDRADYVGPKRVAR